MDVDMASNSTDESVRIRRAIGAARAGGKRGARVEPIAEPEAAVVPKVAAPVATIAPRDEAVADKKDRDEGPEDAEGSGSRYQEESENGADDGSGYGSEAGDDQSEAGDFHDEEDEEEQLNGHAG
jgi:hypothetical protein